MTRFIAPLTTMALAAITMSSTSEAFTPAARPIPKNLYFVSAVDVETNTAEAPPMPPQELESSPAAAAASAPPKAPKKKAGGAVHKTGVLSPFVVLGKRVLGDEELSKLRAKIIGEHTKVIGAFVDTANTKFGQSALEMLFQLADTDGSGTIEEEELAAALQKLGFELKDKQVKGIFDRADADKNGAIDLEEFKSSAPSTLRTNLAKLAKKNGGDMGLLV